MHVQFRAVGWLRNWLFSCVLVLFVSFFFIQGVQNTIRARVLCILNIGVYASSSYLPSSSSFCGLRSFYRLLQNAKLLLFFYNQNPKNI